MHYSNLVIIEPLTNGDTVRSRVEATLAPYKDQWWDWYQIGGRWTGTLDGYDPEQDERNIKTCDICHGTGTRTDMVVANGCNGCQGKGKRVTWPTQWADHPGDVMPIDALTEEQYDKFFRVVAPYNVFGGEDYLPWKPVGEMFPRRERPPLEWLKKEYAGHTVVVVDNHN